MFDFDDYKNLTDYTFHYPVQEVLKTQYAQYKRKIQNNMLSFDKWVLETVKSSVIRGYNKYAEIEPEWARLKYYMDNIQVSKSLQKVCIIYDQALLLLFDSHPLPPNFII
ncbi:MAG: hypothetical protein E7416_03690 [Ruminococcaceae bacterium]|nr:hypothetical protein [Oscillospiraceae bacterium]